MQIPVTNPNTLLDQAKRFPPNLAATMPVPVQQTLMRWIFENYAWPQIMERRRFEDKWDRLHQMYKVEANKEPTIERLRKKKDREEDPTQEDEPKEIGDTLIFDTVDRLKNLNHFISWKDGSPVQFNKPRFLATPLEDEFYKPTANKLKAANALIDFNITNQNVFLKHLLASQHFHLYGLVFAISDFQFRAENDIKPDGTPQQVISKIGVTFEPTSIRKVWLNYTIPLHEMQNQPCPFWFNVEPRFVALQNAYDPALNPHGFANLDKIGPGKYMMGSETQNWQKTLTNAFGEGSATTLLRPEFGTEARWTFCPMLPLDDAGNFDPASANYQRFIVEVFSANLTQGQLTPVRIQKMFYPKKLLPIYGVSHIPDLDSGAYAPSIAEILESHYDSIVKAKNQYLKNKDDINDPQTWAVSGSPALNQDLYNRKRTIEVLGPNDFGYRTVIDATHSTAAFMAMARDAGQTTGKAVDALLGKAMGSRTTATEASNAFQAAMSGATTDINIFNNGLMCPYADRIWWFSGYFMDIDLIKRITGAYGTPLSIEDMNISVGISRDIGSTYIESIVKQQHLRYALEAATRSPYLRQDVLWKAFFSELRLPEALAAVQDNNYEAEITLSNNQAIETYLGRRILINPSQDHDIAIRVKTKFLEDTESHWNREFAGLPYEPMPQFTRAQFVAQQITLHQQFQMQILQMQMLQAQADAALGARSEEAQKAGVGGSFPVPTISTTAGEVASSVGALA